MASRRTTYHLVLMNDRDHHRQVTFREMAEVDEDPSVVNLFNSHPLTGKKRKFNNLKKLKQL